MRRTLIASAFALIGLAAAAPPQAMPFPPADEAGASVTLVAYGCGPGWTRGPYGHCHPIGGPRPVYGYHPYARSYAYGRHCWWRGGVRVCR